MPEKPPENDDFNVLALPLSAHGCQWGVMRLLKGWMWKHGSNPFVIVGHRIGSSMVDIYKPWSIV